MSITVAPAGTQAAAPNSPRTVRSARSVRIAGCQGAAQQSLPMRLRPPVPRTAGELLRQARRDLAEAERETGTAELFTASYLAALRGAAAVLAAKGRPHRGRARPTSAWLLLESSVPELREWAVFFTAHSAAHAAAQSGITRGLTRRAADDLHRQAGQFLHLAERTILGAG